MDFLCGIPSHNKSCPRQTEILPETSVPPPVVNDMSLIFARLLNLDFRWLANHILVFTCIMPMHS